jgi:hypothetical protein
MTSGSNLDDRSGWPPVPRETLCVGQELGSGQQHGVAETVVLDLVGLLLVPGGVQHAHSGRHRGRHVVLDLTLCHRHAVINRVYVFHEVLVQLAVAHIQEILSWGHTSIVTQSFSQNSTTKMLVDQTSRR